MRSTLLGAAACLLSTICALGADMGTPIAIPPALQPLTWTGCYAGGQAGGDQVAETLAGPRAGLDGEARVALAARLAVHRTLAVQHLGEDAGA